MLTAVKLHQLVNWAASAETCTGPDWPPVQAGRCQGLQWTLATPEPATAPQATLPLATPRALYTRGCTSLSRAETARLAEMRESRGVGGLCGTDNTMVEVRACFLIAHGM